MMSNSLLFCIRTLIQVATTIGLGRPSAQSVRQFFGAEQCPNRRWRSTLAQKQSPLQWRCTLTCARRLFITWRFPFPSRLATLSSQQNVHSHLKATIAYGKAFPYKVNPVLCESILYPSGAVKAQAKQPTAHKQGCQLFRSSISAVL